jgi:hypothetical protein
MFDVKSFNDSDYETFCHWTESYGWSGRMPRTALPPIGVVVSGELSRLPMAMGFLFYIEGCDLCFMDFVVADPTLPTSRKILATQQVIKKLQEIAKEKTNNKGWIYSMSANKAYIRIAKSQGFQDAEQEVSTVFYPLSENTERVGFLCSEVKE